MNQTHSGIFSGPDSRADTLQPSQRLSSPLNNDEVNIGWIPYWNLFPLFVELQVELQRSEPQSLPLSLPRVVADTSGHPAMVNAALRNGSIDVAPASSVNLLHASEGRSEVDLALPLGVCANGEVKSVYLGIHGNYQCFDAIKKRQHILEQTFHEICRDCQNIRDVREAARFLFSSSGSFSQLYLEADIASVEQPVVVKLTGASETSVALTKILCHFWFGSAVSYVDDTFSGRVDMELLIGDAALYARGSFSDHIDISEAWNRLTQMPFVFAAWQGKANLFGHSERMHLLSEKILNAAETAEYYMHYQPERYLRGKHTTHFSSYFSNDKYSSRLLQEMMPEYWNCLYYRISSSEQMGLQMFLELVRCFRRLGSLSVR